MRYTIELKTIKIQVNEPKQKEKLKGSQEAYSIAKEIYKQLDSDQEHFTAFFLNAQNKVNGFKTLFSGGQCEAQIDPRIIFRNALLFGAAGIILVHNHPSGALSPSPGDRTITDKIKRAGDLMGIKILDHIIITDAGYYSFADMGEI